MSKKSEENPESKTIKPKRKKKAVEQAPVPPVTIGEVASVEEPVPVTGALEEIPPKPEKKKKAASKKSGTEGKGKETPAAKKAPRKSQKSGEKAGGPAGKPPTREEIELRAYFISERRHQMGLPGDPSSDWVEAENQLCAEAGIIR